MCVKCQIQVVTGENRLYQHWPALNPSYDEMRDTLGKTIAFTSGNGEKTTLKGSTFKRLF